MNHISPPTRLKHSKNLKQHWSVKKVLQYLENKPNKPYTDWTYLLMKVRTSAANECVNERMNERTSERTNEKNDIIKGFVWKRTTKYVEKVQRKSAETAISSIFPVFSAGKKFLSKIGLGHILSIINTHLCAKNQKKLMMKSRENAKKTVFPAYFRHFRLEKYVFRKSGTVTFQTLPFCSSVQNFMKKHKVQLEKFKKYRFSGDF